MSITTIVIGFVVIGSMLRFWWKNGREISKLYKLPGPNIIECIKTALIISFGDRKSVFTLPSRWFKKYGSVVGGWYGYMAVVLLRDPKHIEKIVRHDPLCNRLPDYFCEKFMFPFKGGIFTVEGNDWKSRRKTLNNAFHVNILESFVDDFDRNSKKLRERLNELADGSFHRIDVLVAQCALDMVIETTFADNFDVQKRNDVDLIENTMKVIEFQTTRILKPWLFSDWIFKRSKECREIEEVIEFFDKAITPKIKVKKYLHKIMKKQDNSVYTFLHAEDTSDEDVLGEIKSFAGAGTETTSTTCCFALAILSERQDIQQKVFEEQKKLFGEQSFRPVEKDDLEYMPYLEQVLKETLRLFPPLPYLLRFTVDDVDIGDGYIVPKGTLVVMDIFQGHRIPKYFPDPEKFDPERFSPENSIGRHPFSFIPFGLGRRICIGKKYAMMEMKTIMSTLIRRFHFLEVKGGMKGLLDGLQVGLVLHPTSRFYFKFQPR